MQTENKTTVDTLAKNDIARVAGFKKGRRKLVSKLLEMGVSKGSEIEIVRFAPLGDPIHIRVLGVNFSLRKDEAKYILVVKNR